MGYHSQVKGSRGTDQRRGAQRRKKIKAKEPKRQPIGKYAPETENIPTSQDAVNRIFGTIHNLENQRFVLAPFSDHLNRWLTNLNQAVSEFQSNPTVSPDDKFTNEYSQIITDVKSTLEKTKQKEDTSTKTMESLSGDKVLLERIEKDYAEATAEIQHRKTAENKRLSTNVDLNKEDLNRITQMKTGIFRISKKDKTRKEAEATERLNSSENELTSAMERFAEEQERLKQKYESERKPIIERIQVYQAEIQNQEIDGTVEGRRAACETLRNSVDSFLLRKQLPHPEE